MIDQHERCRGKMDMSSFVFCFHFCILIFFIDQTRHAINVYDEDAGVWGDGGDERGELRRGYKKSAGAEVKMPGKASCHLFSFLFSVS